MTYDEIIERVSAKLNLPKKLIDRTYKSYWRAVREHMVSLPLKENLSDKEFMEMQPNVNIPSIGKLYVTLDRYKRMKKVHKILTKKSKDKDVAHNED